MGYDALHDLPQDVRNVLPEDAQHVFKDAYNDAEKEVHHDNKKALEIAWSAVRKKFHQDENGVWKDGASDG